MGKKTSLETVEDLIEQLTEELEDGRDRTKKQLMDAISLRERLLGKPITKINNEAFAEYKEICNEELGRWFSENGTDYKNYLGRQWQLLRNIILRGHRNSKPATRLVQI